jgi:hypothetical protein
MTEERKGPIEGFDNVQKAYRFAIDNSKTDLNHTWSIQSHEKEDGIFEYRVSRDDSRPYSIGDSPDGWVEVTTLRSQFDEHLGQIVTVTN